MQKINLPYIALIVLVVVSIFSFKVAHENMETSSQLELLKTGIKRAGDSSVDLLMAMPESHYTFRPNEEMKSFAGEAGHMIRKLEQLHNSLNTGYASQKMRNLHNKSAIINEIDYSFDCLQTSLEMGRYDQDVHARITDFLSVNENQRNKLMVYLVLKGIEI